MIANFCFCVIAHFTKRIVDGVYTHRLIGIAITNEDDFLIATKFLSFFQGGNCLFSQWDKVRCFHLGASARVFHPQKFLALCWNGPEHILEFNFRRRGKKISPERTKVSIVSRKAGSDYYRDIFHFIMRRIRLFRI